MVHGPATDWCNATLGAARRTPHAARRTPHAARRTPHATRISQYFGPAEWNQVARRDAAPSGPRNCPILRQTHPNPGPEDLISTPATRLCGRERASRPFLFSTAEKLRARSAPLAEDLLRVSPDRLRIRGLQRTLRQISQFRNRHARQSCPHAIHRARLNG